MVLVVQRPPLPRLDKPAPWANETYGQYYSDHDGHATTCTVETAVEPARYERKMGDSELSYYLPSRASGVNDMYLHLGFTAPDRLVAHHRVQVVWAILRGRHPLLASTVEMRDYDDVRFVYSPPTSPSKAIASAGDNLEYRSEGQHALIDSYLNGPRTLSNERLSCLIVAHEPPAHHDSPPPTPIGAQMDEDVLRSHHILICAAHFLGDGMALHTFANEFFGLLGSTRSQADLEEMLDAEWQKRWGAMSDDNAVLPKSMEDHFVVGSNKFRRMAAHVDFEKSQEKLIGGHAFPRRSNETRNTVVPTVPFDSKQTKKMLQRCKAHGVSISAALFALCNIAWARMQTGKQDLPMMTYSALNLRPYFNTKDLCDSYWFLAVGYFNVILPTFLPSSMDIARTFWYRARSAKEQSTRAAKSPLVASRSLEMAVERGRRARAWAKEDDDKERGVWTAPPRPATKVAAAPRAPSTATLGLSLLGNLDAMYKHSSFPDIRMHALTTGSRQRNGGMLLFGYTFAGQLWISLGYDENGFDKQFVEKFWGNVLSGVEEFLISDD